MARRDDFVDEAGPVVGPFLFQHGNENEVELVKKGLVGSQRFFGTGALNDELNNEVSDTWVCLPKSANNTQLTLMSGKLVSTPIKN